MNIETVRQEYVCAPNIMMAIDRAPWADRITPNGYRRFLAVRFEINNSQELQPEL